MFTGLKFYKRIVSILAIIAILGTTFSPVYAARTDETWQERSSSYLETIWREGRDILINGVSKYLNFGTFSGESGYGFRDNGGDMEFKNDGGTWAGIGSGSGAETDPLSWSKASDQTLLTGDKSGSFDLTTTGKASVGEIDWTGGNVIYVPIGSSINTAVVNATAGDTLILGAGTYALDATVACNKSIRIIGQGMGRTNITHSGANAAAFTVTADNVYISDLSISVTSTTSGGYGVNVNQTAAAPITNIRLKNLDIAMTSSSSSTYGVRWADVTLGYIDNVRVNSVSSGVTANYGITFISTAVSTTNTLYLNNFDATTDGSPTSRGIYIAGTATNTVYVSNCKAKAINGSTASYALQVNSATTNAYAYNNMFDGTTADMYGDAGVIYSYNNYLVNNLILYSTISNIVHAKSYSGDLEVRKDTGSATLSPVTLTLKSLKSVSDWDIANNWANVDFYSMDASGPGASVRGRIGARFENTAGSLTSLVFQPSSATGLFDALKITSNGDVEIPADSKKLLFGAGDDVSMEYTGSYWKMELEGVEFFHNYSDPTSNGGNLFIGKNAGNYTMSPAGGASYLSSRNTGIGENALRSLTTGYYNVAMGYNALQSLQTGNNNFALGYGAGYALKGSANVIIGGTAFTKSGTDGTATYRNIALGYAVGAYNYLGSDNIAIGHQSLQGTSGDTTLDGARNTAIGSYSGKNIGKGDDNVLVGYQVGYNLTTGSSNVFLGNRTGYRQTTNSNLLIVDNQIRADVATEASNSIIYGVMAAAPADQDLYINADVFLKADSRSLRFGAGDDASITFDGNSLNIVANAVTAADALEFTAGSYTFNVPADTDNVINFFGTTNSGVLTWMEDEDYFKFSDDIKMVDDETILLGGTGFVDSPKYKAGGTEPVSDGTYNFDGSAAGTVATMTFKGGICTGITTR